MVERTAIYISPATGFRPAMNIELEVAALAAIGVTVRVMDPQNGFDGALHTARRLSDPAAECRYWEACYGALCDGIDQVGAVGNFALVGFNFGGSLAALYAARQAHALNSGQGSRPAALVVAGSVPRLSRFWLSSRHPVAIAARAASVPSRDYADETRRFDLLTNLSAWSAIPTLVQCGKQDDWIDPDQASEQDRSLSGDIQRRWYDDDHDMASAPSRTDRVHFLRDYFADC